MCDRTKTEILARNLAFEYFRGAKEKPYTKDWNRELSLAELSEVYWEEWTKAATTILGVLDNHNE